MADDKTTETSPELEKNDVVAEEKVEAEAKDEKTPETPVTEPITNGSTTPETPKEETLIPDEPVAENKEIERTEQPKVEAVSEILPNGHPTEAPKSETPESPEPVQSETSKPEEAIVEKSEPAPTTEIPVEKEVCVEKMPLIEPTPPPLPANPPPSSVATFAATTMAPELAAPLEPVDPAPADPAPADLAPVDPAPADPVLADLVPADPAPADPAPLPVTSTASDDTQPIDTIEDQCSLPVINQNAEVMPLQPSISITDVDEQPTEPSLLEDRAEVTELPTTNDIVPDDDLLQSNIVDEITTNLPEEPRVSDLECIEIAVDDDATQQNEAASVNKFDDLKPSENEKIIENGEQDKESDEATPAVVESCPEFDSSKITNGVPEVDAEQLLKKPISVPEMETDESREDVAVMTNGEHAGPQPAGPPRDEARDASRDTPQEVVPASDKLAELIPEVPSVPELKTELETQSDVAVRN
ncbi:unnamed protein product, partial [Brenthis ino]